MRYTDEEQARQQLIELNRYYLEDNHNINLHKYVDKLMSDQQYRLLVKAKTLLENKRERRNITLVVAFGVLTILSAIVGTTLLQNILSDAGKIILLLAPAGLGYALYSYLDSKLSIAEIEIRNQLHTTKSYKQLSIIREISKYLQDESKYDSIERIEAFMKDWTNGN